MGVDVSKVHGQLFNSKIGSTVTNRVRSVSLKMLSATLTFAQTHHCDITETILCCWEVANPSKAKGEIRPQWHVKDTLHTVIFMRKQYHLIIMRDQNPPPPTSHMLNRLTTRHTLYSQYVESGNYIIIIFMREENPPPPMTNMLNGLTTSTLSSWGIKIRYLLKTICWLGK